MVTWMKKQVARILIKNKLKSLGIKGDPLTTLSDAGADVYVIYQLAMKAWATHGDKLTDLFKDQTSKATDFIKESESKLKEINKCLDKIKDNSQQAE